MVRTLSSRLKDFLRAEGVYLLGSCDFVPAVSEVGVLVACSRFALARAALAGDILTFFAGEWPVALVPNAGPLGAVAATLLRLPLAGPMLARKRSLHVS